MADPISLLDAMSDEELRFLIRASDTNLLAFMPREDPVIASLIDQGFLETMPDADPGHETLIISDKGRSVVDLIMTERECPPT